jgi:hypothetical protein
MKTKFGVIGAVAGLAAAVCLALWGCPLTTMDDYYVSKTSQSQNNEDLVVREYNLQAYVPAPTAGAVPVKAVEGRRDLEGAVVWMDADGQALPESFAVFELGAVYHAAITLTAKEDYFFDPAAYFKYYPADAVASQPEVDTDAGDAGRTRARSVTVTYKGAATAIPVVPLPIDLTDWVPKPVTGGSPVRTFYAGAYGGTVEWTAAVGWTPNGGPLDGGPLDGLFQGGAAYTAAAILYPGAGYVFPGGAVPVIHNGAVSSPVPFAPGSGGTLEGALTFPGASTGVAEPAPVDDMDLTYKVPAPVTGGSPLGYLSAPQYAGNVAWAAGGGPYSGVFQAGAVYTATVTLTAAAGFTFTGMEANAFTHEGRDKDAAKEPNPANEAGSGTVTVVFPAADATTAKPVSDLDLTGRVPAPTAGGVPVTYFFPPQWPQYTGNVAWTAGGGLPVTGLFQEGMAYTATVTLTAVSGFTFAGVGANAFWHDGKDAVVTNGANPKTVTVVFPALGGGEGDVGLNPTW